MEKALRVVEVFRDGGKPYMKFTMQVRILCEQSITSISDLDLAFPTPVVRAVAKYLDLG